MTEQLNPTKQGLCEIVDLARLADNGGEQTASVDGHFEWFVITGGSGLLEMDCRSFELRSNRVFCLPPSTGYRLHSLEAAEGFYIRIHSGWLQREDGGPTLWKLSYHLPALSRLTYIDFEPRAFGDLVPLVMLLAREGQNREMFREELMVQYLQLLLVHLIRGCGSDAEPIVSDRNYRLAERFVALVDQHFKSNRQVADYASRLGVSPNYLNQVVKVVTGFPASDHIRKRVVLEAKRHAMYSDCSMKELSYMLGFPESSHFSKFFKKETGNTFSTYKKSPAARGSLERRII
jgi:AraC family transcriptional activator of pobA